MATCVWCGLHKPITELRHPASSRGKTPSTCHSCRELHPDQAWCDFHNWPHPREHFQATPKRPLGVLNICHDASAYLAAAKRSQPYRTCPSCHEERESWFFRGGQDKRHACRDCEAAHPGKHWCVDCDAWLPVEQFGMTGRGAKFATVRCKPCRIAHGHGVTRAFLTELTGSAIPTCAACGSTEDIKIDHDHAHCKSHRGCRECVRGYLCHQCNTAEGLLRTSARVQLLADHMKRLGL